MTGNANSGRKATIDLPAARLLLYDCLQEPIGIVLRTSDTEKALRVLWEARASDPILEVLKVLRSPLPDGDIIITNGDWRGSTPPSKPGDQP